MNITGKLLIAILFSLCAFGTAKASHYRAGEVYYQCIGQLQYRVTIVTYTKYDGLADNDQILICYGDDTTHYVLDRGNGPDVSPANGFPDGEIIASSPITIKKNTYTGIHTYHSAPVNQYYVIQFNDVNRTNGILNIFDPLNVAFYVEDTLWFKNDLASLGFNSSPILDCPPIDYAFLNQTFVHNPCPRDPDGDSLDFKLIPCRQALGQIVPGYSYPDDYCHSNGQPGNTLTIDAHTGQLTWQTPCFTGIFNIAILVTEFRNGLEIGTLVRDMQIVVLNEYNQPPILASIPDTCIWAGEQLNRQVIASDPDPAQTITLSANGAAFHALSSPAVFNQAGNPSNPVAGTFAWNTDCSHISAQPYVVVFRAEDSYTVAGGPVPAVAVQPWQISVIAPPPLGVTASVNNQAVTISWQNPYTCASSPYFRGFSVWRKTGCDLFDPDHCETGLAGRGFTKITGANVFTYSFADNTAVPGQQYTYRVLAHFSKLSPNGIYQFDASASVASNGVCVFMPVVAPAIINVDVQQTDVNTGQIFVRWVKPLTGGNNLDTLQHLPPYHFDLYRGTGFNFNNPVLIHSSVNATSFSALTDTFFTDTGLNTFDSAYSYKVVFYSGTDTVGASAIASSVFLHIQPSDQSLYLTWSENIPWTNDSFAVFKMNNATSAFSAIDTTYNHFYADTGLVNDTSYCYFVRSIGRYALAELPRPLLNNSQKTCSVPRDTVPPCPPLLTVRNNCDQNTATWTDEQFTNFLNWNLATGSCADDVNRYHIYFGADASHLNALTTILSKDSLAFDHHLQQSLAGCYAITATDRTGNESQLSNVVCVDNCPYYVLPNTFTPNGDGANEKFTPFKPYRFITKIEMKIYNRWGEEVFSTDDPEINWDGKDPKTGKDLSEGVYVYSGYYYELHQDGLVRKPLNGKEKGGGFIHLIRGNKL